VTTAHSGIPDVFSDGDNGFLVQVRSPESIRDVFERILREPAALVDIGVRNRNLAHARYRTSTYQSSLMGILQLTSDRPASTACTSSPASGR